ncbi:MAG: DUF4910 domain-containing protein [Asgard group archaeon]|nr:DUF4910 domain-containing protein [Asgard group archaeon]
MDFKEEFDHIAAFRTMRALCERYSSRVSGSTQELEAMRYLVQQFRKKVGFYPVVDQYPVKYYKGHYASIQILPDGDIIEGRPQWMTINSPSTGVEDELQVVYLDGENIVASDNFTHKIVIIKSSKDYLTPDIFIQIKEIYKQKPSGVIILSSYHPEVIRSDIIFKDYSIFSEIPTIILPEAKFPIENIEGKKGKLLIFGEIDRGNLFNISLIIPGSKKEFILVYANHDTVENTQGARENAAGVAILLEVAKKISRYKLKYSYRFITLGGKEMGLEGMRKILDDYDTSNVILGINIDSIDSNPNKIVLSVSGDEYLMEIVETINESNDFPIETEKGIPLGKDNLVMTEKDIPSITIMLKDNESKNIFRTELDSIDEYDPESLKKVGDYLLKFISKMEQMKEVEFTKNIPRDLKVEAVKYFEILRLYQE